MFYVILKFGIENDEGQRKVIKVTTVFKNEEQFESIDDLHDCVIHLANEWKGVDEGYHVEELYIHEVLNKCPEGVDVWNLTHLDIDSDSD